MLAAAVRKEVQLLLRDRGALASLFLLPVIFIAAFGSMFSADDGEGERRPLPVYAAETETAGAALRSLERSEAFALEPLPSPAAVRQAIADGDAVAGLVLESSYAPLAGAPAELVMDEAVSPAVRGPVEGAVRGALAQALFGGRELPPLYVVTSPPGMREPLAGVGGFQVAVPGNAVLFGFFLALTVGLSFVEERKGGTFRRILAAPVRRSAVLAAKLVPFFLIGLVQMAFLFGVGAAAFGMRVGGSPLALVALTCAVVACAVALGLFIASFSGTEKQVGGVGSIGLLIMGLLGGAMVPRLIMPETMQTLGLATPHAWALEGYYDVLVRSGTTLGDVMPEIAAVLGFALVFGVIGALRFRFER